MLRSAPYIYFWEIFQSDLTAIEVAKFTPSDLPKWSPRNWAIWGLIRLLVCGEGQIESHPEVGQMRLSLVRTERAFRVGRSLNEGAATPRNVAAGDSSPLQEAGKWVPLRRWLMLSLRDNWVEICNSNLIWETSCFLPATSDRRLVGETVTFKNLLQENLNFVKSQVPILNLI